MREAHFETETGERYKVLLPDDAPDEHAEYGIIVGPPPLDELNLPTEVAVRLNNQLFDRGLFTWREVRQRREELLAVWQAVLRVDVGRLHDVYETTRSSK
jgi:hypothetical protein